MNHEPCQCEVYQVCPQCDPETHARILEKHKPQAGINDPEVGRCSACNRCTWDRNEIGKLCKLTQPDGTKCPGNFWSVSRPKSQAQTFPKFEVFPKMPRLSREIVITEKLDGTNAQLYIDETGKNMMAGSRNRWLTASTDNYGFFKWANDHYSELLALGPGHHFGEWWGAGIQRRYGLAEKRFSLFNTSRWLPGNTRVEYALPGQELCPPCCSVVPVLYSGEFETDRIRGILHHLKITGSAAAPGFMQPEGIVIYHTAAKCYFKKTIEHDSTGKPE